MRAALLLPLLTLLLRLRGFRYTQRFLQKKIHAKAVRPALSSEAEVCAWTCRMLLAAARYSPFPSTCLERSLALWWLLRRQGVAVELRIGVRKEQKQMAAHAWVERNGVAVGEPEAPHLHYAAFKEEISGENS